MKITVIDGAIMRVECDALIVGLNRDRKWYGALHIAITDVVGNDYHEQLAFALQQEPELDYKVTVRVGEHHGRFHDIVFIVDDSSSLNVIVSLGLTLASKCKYASVALPLIPFGDMRNHGEVDDVILREMVGLLIDQRNDPDNNIGKLSIVVYDDPDLSDKLRKLLDASL